MPKKFDFEKQLESLETVAGELADGELSLDEAIEAYAKGIKTYKACADYLTSAEKKVKVMTRQLDGTLAEEPFEDVDSFEDEHSETT